MLTDGRRSKTDPKTSPEQSAIFQRVRDINKTNCDRQTDRRTFHDDWAKSVTSRENAPHPGSHVFQRTGSIFKLNSLFTRKTAPPTGDHVFQRTGTTFELNKHINKTTILTNFKLDRGIIRKNLLIKFHEDRRRNMASRVLTRKTAPPTGGHIFQRTGTTFELNQHIIKTTMLTNFLPSVELDRGTIWTKLLTKFHKDQTRNMVSREFTNKCGRTDGQTTEKDRSQKLT
ncbi:hypothetical protein DPMN_072406 [Dreissena polymorpha]|uniref:Uncharacterized protein n=1 Tax=Dreissena polymorpha TaxID=45954 RepID=A0A9D4BXI6_DREPO|nr:hypothetical protein DPMN_072406 [Dreissena polymorpha]